MNGYAFALGLSGLDLSSEDTLDSQTFSHSVLHLFSRAIVRPKCIPNSRGVLSMTELIDMYHAHEATA
jgi:hypothetical protein